MSNEINPAMMVRGPGQFVRINDAFFQATGLNADKLAEHDFIDWLEEEDQQTVHATLVDGNKNALCVRHRTADGNTIQLQIRIQSTSEGNVVLGRMSDSDQMSNAYVEEFDEGTVTGTLETIARIVEDQNPGYKCSILLVDQNHFVRGAGPSLTEEYNAAIDGQPIGPTVGSCGTAIYWNIPVIVSDIQADPLWRDLAPLAKDAGVAACWSHPFTSSSGEVLGALALYAIKPESPTDTQLESLRAAARITGLAVERGRVEEALREKQAREAELEGQLRQAAKMEALGVLAGGVAHDFNNLLGTIHGSAEIALMDLPHSHPAREMMDRIVQTSQRAGEFCNQMLAYAGRGTMQTELLEFGKLIFEVNSLAHAALSKKAVLKYKLHDSATYIDADENQLLQVVLNLVTNAAEAIGDAEGVIEIETNLVHHDEETLARLGSDIPLSPGEYVQLKVKDTGCGMDKETMSRIFDPFYTTKFTGRGLGLAAVTGIVRKHNGLIFMDSQLGIGSVFTVLLPTVKTPERANAKREQVLNKLPVAKKILVVDDEDELRDVFRRLLERNGFDVVEAEDGEAALSILEVNPTGFDCVLLDLSMPKLSGEEVFQRIRATGSDLPIVLISGFSEQEIFDRLDGAKIDGTLNKPVRASLLVETLHTAIGD